MRVGQGRGPAAAAAAAPEAGAGPAALREAATRTAKGRALAALEAEWAAGAGPPHTFAKLRLFGAAEADVRVTLYRDHAAWCPYCQKVWMLLEEKRIPYRVEHVNMRSYGDKPPEFLRKVPSGLLPVLELDGQFITESLVIMQVLDDTFADGHPNRMIPPKDSPLFDEANRLLGLERKLFGAWCSFLFRPGGLLGDGRREFESQLTVMDEKLGKYEGPWFLPGGAPSLVDLQYVTHLERMNASCLFWKGLKCRGSGRWPNVDRWFAAFEDRPAYLATKSDYYTHVMNIEPQYGPAFADNGPSAVEARAAIGGAGWTLPVAVGPDSPEPVLPATTEGPAAAKQEAAYRLTKNFDAIVRFACRGVGQPGRKRFQAPLADPYAEPDVAFIPVLEPVLAEVARALLEGPSDAAIRVGDADAVKAVQACLGYLRDRVGVPRDMSYPAALELRATLNHVAGRCSPA